MKIAITGHRPHKLGNDYDLVSPLTKKIKSEICDILSDHRPTTLITGMALGIDTLFAKIAIEWDIPFIAAVPCYNQESKWPIKSQNIYISIINHPLCCLKFVKEGEYDNTCMQKRNEWMVDNCDKLIAVWDGTGGGTANCVRYAESVGKEVLRIDVKKLREEN